MLMWCCNWPNWCKTDELDMFPLISATHKCYMIRIQCELLAFDSAKALGQTLLNRLPRTLGGIADFPEMRPTSDWPAQRKVNIQSNLPCSQLRQIQNATNSPTPEGIGQREEEAITCLFQIVQVLVKIREWHMLENLAANNHIMLLFEVAPKFVKWGNNVRFQIGIYVCCGNANSSTLEK